MKTIGGYFELELKNNGSIFHDEALALNTGRNAFEHVLLVKTVRKIHIPYFICQAMLAPLKKLKINYQFYKIREDFSPIINKIESDDFILLTNYFGICNDFIKRYSDLIENVIVDNSQAFFEKPFKNKSTIYSPRKFFGIPDGGFVYTDMQDSEYSTDCSVDRFDHLIQRADRSAEFGYKSYLENEEHLSNQPIKLMSNISKKLLNSIDFLSVSEIRRKNFIFIHKKLKKLNKLSDFIDNADYSVPMSYPLWIEKGKELRLQLINEGIYTGVYWPNVLESTIESDIEYEFTNNIIHLPIDQRYSEIELTTVIDTIKKII